MHLFSHLVLQDGRRFLPVAMVGSGANSKELMSPGGRFGSLQGISESSLGLGWILSPAPEMLSTGPLQHMASLPLVLCL